MAEKSGSQYAGALGYAGQDQKSSNSDHQYFLRSLNCELRDEVFDEPVSEWMKLK